MTVLDWSAELDRVAARDSVRTPLKLDPALAAAFAAEDDWDEPDPTPEPEQAHVRACLDCARPMRPHSALVKDHPGTVREGGRGRCDTCAHHYRKKHGIRRGQKSWGPCTECGRLQRPAYVRSADAPGRVSSSGNGICSACYYRARTGAKPRNYCPPACVDCNRAMSPGTKRAPGTVRHIGHGRCDACYSRRRRETGKKTT